MRPLQLTILLLLLAGSPCFSQFADQGSGNYTRQIWWLNWAGFTVQNGASKTFTTNNGLTIKASFSNVSAAVPTPWIMDTWPGSLLWFLYNFSDPTILPALYQENSPDNYNYTLTITATRNGQAVPFTLVTADAEASNSGETTTIQTNGGNWQSIEFFRNSTETDDPLAGCGTNNIAITNTYAGSLTNPTPYGQNVLITTQSPGANPLVVACNFNHAGTTGGMALAFGIFFPTDRGDLPVTGYGTAQHELLYTPSNSCNFNPPFPTLNQVTNLHIGLVPGDPDPIQYDNDDSIGVDEEGVSSFAVYNNTGTYSVNLTVTNTSGSNAFLTGWFDYNRDGTFESNESVTATIPNNATTATLTWTGLPQYLPQGTATGYGFRFRMSSNQAATQAATGYAPDGEVEDYFVPSSNLCEPVPIAVSPDQTICAGQSVTLAASGGTLFTWSPSTSLSNPTIANPVATPSTTTTYNVITSTTQGCSSTPDSITLAVNPSPTLSITGANEVCIGHPDTLTASGATTYSWSANQQVIAVGPTLTTNPGASSWFYATGTGPNGCTTTDSIDVTVKQLPVFTAAAASSLVCINDTVRLTASGGDQYAWQSASGQPLGNTDTIVVSPGSNTDYQVQITDNICHLSQTAEVPITVKDLPDIAASSSNNITCTVAQATLHATGGIAYEWAPAQGISNLNSANPVVNPTQSTTYYLKGTGANGCSNIDSVNVKVDFNSELSHFPVASAFTPNNDGRNDCFGLRNWPQIGTVEFSVYNRWGILVFYTTDVNQCWDGTYKGTPQPAGAYVYQIKAAGICGTAFRTGTVILIR
jgi:gliding motility-associated-like protein